MNFILSKGQNLNIQTKKLSELWLEPVNHVRIFNEYDLFITDLAGLVLLENRALIIEGDIVNYQNSKKEKKEINLNEIGWPMPDNYSGSFSLIQIDRNKVYLANDLLGIYPLYYSEMHDQILASNSILAFSLFNFNDIDQVGVFQRRYSTNKINYGQRTIVEGVKRILPGQCVIFRGNNIYYKYDNTLYSFNPDVEISLEETAAFYWDFLINEYKLGLSNFSELIIGLSGGIDSRFMLCFVPESKKKSLVTYGSYPDEIEVSIAERVSKKIKNSNFKFYCVNNSHFPNNEIVNRIVRKTESYYNNHWIPLVEELRSSGYHHEKNMLIGDMCEAIPGKFVGNSIDKKNPIKKIFQKYTYTKSSDEAFMLWKTNKIEFEISNLKRQYKAESFMGLPTSEILERCKSDIEDVFGRIYENQPPLVELYDELYNWYTYIRMLHAKQFLIHKENLKITNPSLYFNNLREVTKIHPKYRVNYKLMDYYFKNFEVAKKFAKIPVAQIPFVGYNAPRKVKLLLWGFRAVVDRLLIKRKMKHKSVAMRYRLFKSLDWPLIYRQKDGLNNLKELTQVEYIACKEIVNTYEKRKNMEKWPLVTFDISLIIGLNKELEIYNANINT